MIERYSRETMTKHWSLESRFHYMLEVEVAVALAQAKLKIIPEAAAKAIKSKAKFNVKSIQEIEKTTKHDVIAFVTDVAKNVGEHGRYVHFGLTSSDVLDTALSLQIRDGLKELLNGMDALLSALKKLSISEAETLCAGRTHGMHAEVTSFGYKMSGFWAELMRHKQRFIRAESTCSVGKLSGAVGAYSFLDKKFENEVCKILKLRREPVATQVVPRDRHAELFCAFSLFAGFLERIALELRHLQRTELLEAEEEFSQGQKGSSAMPHKKNPISAENLTGIARLLRSYVLPALENQALWHERDISHSSVERVILPDAFILTDYALGRITTLISGLQVNAKKMAANMELSQGVLYSSFVLSAMVQAGAERDEAYKKIQSVSHNLKPGENLIAKLNLPKDLKSAVDESKIRARFKTLVSEVFKEGSYE